MSLPAEKPAVASPGPSAAPRRAGSLNLARRPFINTRPVTRVSILLWLLGLLLLLGNVSLFWNYLSGSAAKRDELASLEQDIQRQQKTVGELERRLASLNLAEQNRRVRFLNRKIAERTFSWSLLFDRLAEVLPDDVRLTRLAPKPLSKKSFGAQDDDEPVDDRVLLTIHGVSRSDEGALDFVNSLFAHREWFENPDISRESREEESNTVEFDVQVIYIPGEPAQGGAAAGDTAAGDTATPEVLEAPAPPPAPGPGDSR